MAGRLSAKMAQEEDFENFILMHAMGSNTAGQLGSVIAGGLLLALVTGIYALNNKKAGRSSAAYRSIVISSCPYPGGSQRRGWF